MLSNPNSAPSVGSRSDTSRSTASRSRTAFAYSARFRRWTTKRPGVLWPSQARSSDVASQLVKPAYSASDGRGDPGRRHRPHAQFPQDSLPGSRVAQKIVERAASRLTGPSAGDGVFLLWHATQYYRPWRGTWRHRASSGSPRRLARRQVLRLPRGGVAADRVPLPVCATSARQRRSRSQPLRFRSSCACFSSSSLFACGRLLIAVPLSCRSLLIILLGRVEPAEAEAGDGIVGAQVHQIAESGDHILTRIALRTIRARIAHYRYGLRRTVL